MTEQETAPPPAEHPDMLDLFRACVRDSAERTAIRYFDRAWTYGELDRQGDALAGWLQARGLGPGDRVLVVLQNMPQFLMMLVAVWKVGAIPVPGNPMYRRGELARIVADCRPKAVLCLLDGVEEIGAALALAGVEAAVLATSARAFQGRDDRRVLPAAEPDAPGIERLETLLERPAPPIPPAKPDGEAIGLVLYTSGTTGQPKGAMIRHRSLAYNGQAMRDYCALGPGSRILGIAPFFHITGLSCHVAAAFSARASLVLHYRVEPSLLLDVIREHRPTYTIGAITVFNALMTVPGIVPADLASFDRIYSGGAPIPPALQAEIRRRLGVHVHSSYGMTETTAHTHLAPFMAAIPIDPRSGALSIGQLTPGTQGRIMSDAGEEVATGDFGELWVRGPQVMAGYWNKPAETAAALTDGWMHTGDVAFRDPEGWFYLVDRIKDCIIASGFKVWPREVEDVLYAHPAVHEAAVVGVPDAYRGETVKAFVALKPGAAVTPDRLAEHCRAQLAAYKAPRSIEIVAELPKTATGKIQRMSLRQPGRPG